MAQTYETREQEQLGTELDIAMAQLSEAKRTLEQQEHEIGRIAGAAVAFSAALTGVLALVLAVLAAGAAL